VRFDKLILSRGEPSGVAMDGRVCATAKAGSIWKPCGGGVLRTSCPETERLEILGNCSGGGGGGANELPLHGGFD